MPYETAYIGIATAPNGEFDHFVRQLKTSNLAGGYWRFQSVDDDRRAHARGFTTPEDVLCAAESTDESFDEIFIRWIRGSNDPNLKMALSGTPSQHLQTIYELRLLLGLPISSRGQVPLYPISTKPLLKQYWEAKYRAQRPALDDTANQVPDQPIVSPVTPRPETLNLSQPHNPVPAAPKSPPGRITRARSKEASQAARETPAARATPSQQAPSATQGRSTRPSAARSLSRESAFSSLSNTTVNQGQAPPRYTPLPASKPTLPASSVGRNVPSIPRAALEWGLQSSTSPASPTLGQGISQHNWVHPSSRSSNVGRSSSLPYQSPYGATGAQPEHTSPVIAPQTPPLVGEKHAIAPYSAASTSVTTGKPAPANSVSSPVANTTSLSVSAENGRDSRAIISPETPRHANSTTPPRGVYEPSLDSMGSPTVPQPDSPPPRTEEEPVGELPALEETHAGSNDRPISTDHGNKQPSDNQPSLSQELDQLDVSSPDADGTDERGAAQATDEMPEPLRTYMTELENLPCMDCGEFDSHTWDCHLGNIQPMQNLTILDYRTLTEAVEMFDPGPRRFHFDLHPEPEPEDGPTVIRGMADVIRNEDSYKNDEELHSLPDDLMILVWGFKASGQLRPFEEFDGDSSSDGHV